MLQRMDFTAELVCIRLGEKVLCHLFPGGSPRRPSSVLRLAMVTTIPMSEGAGNLWGMDSVPVRRRGVV